MTSWTGGYVAEIDYTHGYYRELSPVLLQMAMLSKQQDHRARRPFRYLELGFGQGLSLNIHAAACEGEFWGTDFNPSQAGNARDLAAASGANIRILDDSFAELAARADLPEFDIIALHGIWSWVSDDTRRTIVDIARRKLAVGGLFYVSYNCTPGWSAAMPLRHLMNLHLEKASGEAMGMAPRMDAALNFAQQVIDANAAYFRANPLVVERLKGLKAHNKNYLAHEFFNADWHPMPFSQVAEMLDAAKLSFAAPSNLLAHIDLLNLSQAQQQLLSSISSTVLRETVRDYCENQQFRRDIFVKGPRPLPEPRQSAMFRALRFTLLTHPDDVVLKVTGNAGEAQLQAEVYRPILAALAARDFAPKTLEELSADPQLKGLNATQISQALVVLTGLSHAHPAQDDGLIALAKRRTDLLNTHILDKAPYSVDINFLASPVIGGGVAVNRLNQLFLRSLAGGAATPKQLADEAWPILQRQGQRLIRDGKPLENPADNVEELLRVASEFVIKRLPVLKSLKVIPDGLVAPAAGRNNGVGQRAA